MLLYPHQLLFINSQTRLYTKSINTSSVFQFQAKKKPRRYILAYVTHVFYIYIVCSVWTSHCEEKKKKKKKLFQNPCYWAQTKTLSKLSKQQKTFTLTQYVVCRKLMEFFFPMFFRLCFFLHNFNFLISPNIRYIISYYYTHKSSLICQSTQQHTHTHVAWVGKVEA